MYLGIDNNIEIYKVIFNNSEAKYGGLLYIDKSNILTMHQVTAENLTASTSGGFLFANKKNIIEIF